VVWEGDRGDPVPYPIRSFSRHRTRSVSDHSSIVSQRRSRSISNCWLDDIVSATICYVRAESQGEGEIKVAKLTLAGFVG
jgi:hypothetical protein